VDETRRELGAESEASRLRLATPFTHEDVGQIADVFDESEEELFDESGGRAES
jgi:hypothetical protein